MAVRFKKHTTDSFFGHFLYEQIIPKDHFLVKAKRIIDWDRFTKKCLRYYKGSAEVGRAPYNPSVLLRMLFLSYLYNISERQIEERVDLDLSFKYFVGLGVDEKAPDSTSLTYFKERLLEGAGKPAYEQLLREILFQAKQKGIQFGSIKVIDSVHTIADVNTDKDKHRSNKDKGDKPRDPDASWGAKGKKKVQDHQTGKVYRQTEYFYGYKAHVSRNQNGIITSIATTSGNTYDGHHLKTLVEKDNFTPMPKQKTYAADRGYDDGENHEYLKIKKLGDAIKLNRYRTEKINQNKKPWENLKQEKTYYEGLKQRYQIEQTFGQMKQSHGLRRARYLGVDKFHIQASLTALVINLKVIVANMTGSTLKGYGYKGNAVRFDMASP